jgi:hypothetical protein
MSVIMKRFMWHVAGTIRTGENGMEKKLKVPHRRTHNNKVVMNDL